MEEINLDSDKENEEDESLTKAPDQINEETMDTKQKSEKERRDLTITSEQEKELLLQMQRSLQKEISTRTNLQEVRNKEVEQFKKAKESIKQQFDAHYRHLQEILCWYCKSLPINKKTSPIIDLND